MNILCVIFAATVTDYSTRTDVTSGNLLVTYTYGELHAHMASVARRRAPSMNQLLTVKRLPVILPAWLLRSHRAETGVRPSKRSAAPRRSRFVRDRVFEAWRCLPCSHG
jgi:hypothetical protein